MNEFDPEVIDSIARRHLTKPLPEMVEATGRELKPAYPDLIDASLPLVFNAAAGILHQLRIFAMTPREYIMICGSSVGSSGFSGRHPAAFRPYVLMGSLLSCQRRALFDVVAPRPLGAVDCSLEEITL
jgi:hypothetical protein